MTRLWLRLVALFGCFGLLSCGSSPPTRFYILNEVAAAVPAPTAAASKQIPVRVEPIALAPELDRPEIVTRVGPNRVHVAGSDRWAAPLTEQIRRAISDDLSARLPPGLVADPNEPSTKEPRRLLTIAIDEFYGNDNCAVSLRATWTLTNPNYANQSGSERVQMPASAPCTGEMPAAMSRALGTLADQLAPLVIAAN
jgi:uncharacterized lipoprotein YmbA